MNAKDFDNLVLEENEASRELMGLKATEYSNEEDRLENFKQAAGMLSVNPAQALMGMLVKHFVSVGKMSKCPTMHKLEKWDEKLRDIRNYTYLLRAILTDMEIK